MMTHATLPVAQVIADSTVRVYSGVGLARLVG
jgi:hypothetical protein